MKKKGVLLLAVILLIIFIVLISSRGKKITSPLPKEPSIKVMFEGKERKVTPTEKISILPSPTPTVKGKVEGASTINEEKAVSEEKPTEVPAAEPTKEATPTVEPTVEATPTVEVSLTPSPTP